MSMSINYKKNFLKMLKNEKVEKIVNFDLVASFFIGHFFVLDYMGWKLAPDILYNNMVS